MKKILTTCTYCGCGCGFYLQVREDEIVGVSPSENHPVSRGRLCVKGWNVFEFINHPARLQTPLIKKNGCFREASWKEALRLVADKLTGIKSKFGADALGVLSSAKCTNEENYLLMKFTRAVLGTNNIDHCARLCHASTVAGLAMAFGSGAMTNSIAEIESTDAILVTGSNTTEQHPMIGARILDAVEKGAKLIVVDPRKTKPAQFATIHLRQRPGTDVAWINGFMSVIIKEGLHNLEYINRRTEDFRKVKKAVSKYTPEKVEKITGIPAKDLIAAARIYARAQNAMIFYSMGITQHTTGTDNVLSLANLALLTGQVGRPNSGVNPLRGQNNVQGACDLGALPNVYSGYQAVTDPKIREKFEQAWNTKLPSKPGLTVVEMMEAAEKEKLKGMYIMGENPMLSDPDVSHVKKALERLGFLVVQDIFLTETAELADVVLPGATFAEKDGTFTNTERRVQRVRHTIEPLYKCRPDWQIICNLSSNMGYKMDYNSPSEIMDEIAVLTPIYGGIFYDRLNKGWGLQWPCRDRKDLGTTFLHREMFARGKGRFVPIEYRPPDEEPSKEYPFILTTGRIYFHFHTGTMSRKTSTLHREYPEGFVEINNNDAKKLGVKTGSTVKVTTRRGSIIVKAAVSSQILDKVIFIPFHFAEAKANILTNPALDPKAKIPEYKVCAAKVEPVS